MKFIFLVLLIRFIGSMNTKRQQIPLEVSSWMQKDLTLKRATANARMLTNDTRQNIVLSRKFFADLLNMSYARYRKIAEHEFEKKMFLRDQHRKTDTAMPGLRSYVDMWRFILFAPKKTN